MKQRTKISIDEVKYIQTEIEKLLSLYKDNPDQTTSLQQPKKVKFASVLPTSINQKQSNYNKTTNATPQKAIEKNNKNNNLPKSLQKSNEKMQKNSKSKNKKKKQQNVKNQIKLQKQKVRIFSPQLIKINLTTIFESRPNLEAWEDKNKKNSLQDFTQVTQLSPGQIKKKWTLIQKGSKTSLQNYKNENLYDSKQDKLNKEQTSNNNKHKKLPDTKVNKLNKNKTPERSQKNKSSFQKDLNLQTKKRYFPHGLTQLTQKKKSTPNNFSSVDVLYPSTKQVKKPYHLNNKNEIPIRNDEDYLERKFKQKKQIKQKKQDLVLKYHVLDQRLNKLRQQIIILPLTERFQKFSEQSKIKAKKQYQKALKNYLRYSPLNKLLKNNQKLKTQHEKSISNQSRKMVLNQKKFKQLYQDGRPLWNT